MTASSSGLGTVGRGCLGPMGASMAWSRLRHLCTVVGLMPWRLARAPTPP